MRLVDNIECVLRHAWTVRLLVLTTVLDAAQASVSFFAGTEIVSAPVLAALNVGLSVAALGTRLVAQEKVLGPATGGDA